MGFVTKWRQKMGEFPVLEELNFRRLIEGLEHGFNRKGKVDLGEVLTSPQEDGSIVFTIVAKVK